ncbi:MAG TPA: ABC transporter permease [Gemmatimonadaceae bacterium]|nr:ABC transporter permease [Gemmatimonadaceae bacterium]
MRPPRSRWHGLRRVFRLPTSDARLTREVDDELRFHLEGRVEEFVAAGWSRDDAVAEAQRRFGDYTAYRRQAREIDLVTDQQRRHMDIVDAIRREARQSIRGLVRTPAFSLVALATLVLGIGATTAIFTVLDAVVLRPLPYPAPERLVSITHPVSGAAVTAGSWGVSPAGYFFFRREAHTLAASGIYTTGTLSVRAPDGAARVQSAQITSSLFDVMGARPIAGRLLTTDDDTPNGPLVVVLGYGFWQRNFGGDRSIVGHTIDVEGRPVLVVGVAAAGVTLPMPSAFSSQADLAGFGVDVWLPLQLDPSAPPVNTHPYSMIARLAPGASAGDAERELAALTARLPEIAPSAYSPAFMRQYHFSVAATPLRSQVVGATARVLWVVFGAVALVLVMAAANVANLFLVRLEAHRREAAVRAALGAGRAHLAVHYLAESLMLTLTAGALALLLAWGALHVFIAVAPPSIPRLESVALGWSAVAFTGALSVVLGVVFGIVPLLARRDVDTATLREGGRGLTASRTTRVVRDALIVGQMTLALVLLAAAGLMVRTVEQLRHVKPGFDPQRTLTMHVHVPWSRYGGWAPVAAFHRSLQERVGALPGVRAVGGATDAPLVSFGFCSIVWIEDHPLAPGEVPPCVKVTEAAPGFFAALGLRVQGRVPDWQDAEAGTGAVVVTRALAERFWPGENPIGRGIKGNGSRPPFYRVVGVTDDVRGEGLEKPPVEAVFFPIIPIANAPLWQPPNDVELIVRTSVDDPTTLVPTIRRTIAAIDPSVSVDRVQTLTSVVQHSLARVSFILALLALAAAMAVLLSAVGTYGVIGYLVTQRRSEIGLRVALGAQAWSVTRLVVGRSLRLALLGALIGTVAALATTRLLSSLLYGVRATDPATFAAAVGFLLVVAVLASLAPARRATRVDPVEALRAN